MKKHIYRITLFILFVFFILNSNAQIRVLESFSSSNSSWTTPTSGASTTLSNGYIKCSMALSSGYYRGDLKYTYSSGDTISLGTSDVYIAIKYNDSRPNGTGLKLEFQDFSSTWYNTYTSAPTYYTTSTDGDSIYYYKLTSNSNYASAYTSGVKIKVLTFKIANNTSPDSTYSVDWIATFPTLDDIVTYKDYEEDNTTENNNTITNNKSITAWATKNEICLNNIENNSDITIYSITGSRVLSSTVDAGDTTIPFITKGIFLIQIRCNGKSSIVKIIK